MSTKKRVKISRMVKMHSNEMEDIDEAEAGEIFAIFGIDAATGDTFCDGDMSLMATCTSMFVPDPVLSLKIKPTKKEYS
jgi:elongation factor G